MNVIFPTQDRGHAGTIGLPKRAEPCQCDRGPLIIAPWPTCVTCGRYTQQTIDRTWSDRIREITMRHRHEPLERAA